MKSKTEIRFNLQASVGVIDMILLMRLIVVAGVVAGPIGLHAAEMLDLGPPTQEQRQILKSIFGDEFVDGTNGPFGPKLLVASPDLNNDGSSDIVAVQKAFCSNHSCSFTFMEETGGKWSTLIDIDSWGIPYLNPSKDKHSRPDIIAFDHTTDDCMACSPPHAVLYTWRGDTYTAGGLRGAYIYEGLMKGDAPSPKWDDPSPNTKCQAFTVDAASDNDLFQVFKLERKQHRWMYSVDVKSERDFTNLHIDIDGQGYTAQALPRVNAEELSFVPDPGSTIDPIEAIKHGNIMTIEGDMLGRTHSAQYDLKGSLSAIASILVTCDD